MKKGLPRGQVHVLFCKMFFFLLLKKYFRMKISVKFTSKDMVAQLPPLRCKLTRICSTIHCQSGKMEISCVSLNISVYMCIYMYKNG